MNFLGHISHWNVWEVEISWFLAKCFCKDDLNLNFAVHNWHWYGFSILWNVFKWEIKSIWVLKLALQIWHSWGLHWFKIYKGKLKIKNQKLLCYVSMNKSSQYKLAFFWLKASTRAFTLRTLLRHYTMLKRH